MCGGASLKIVRENCCGVDVASVLNVVVVRIALRNRNAGTAQKRKIKAYN